MGKKNCRLLKNAKEKNANSTTYFNKRKWLLSTYWDYNFKVCVEERYEEK